jgi:hypothetical protein
MPNVTPLKGSRPRVTVHFRDTSNVGIDPSALNFLFTDSEGNETVYVYGTDAEIVRDAAGDYHVDVPVTLPNRFNHGKYFCRYEAFDVSGLPLAAAEVVLEVSTRYPARPV